MASRALSFDLTVRNVHAAIDTEAQHVAITGPSAGGKTTLLCAIAGVLVEARGRIDVGGVTWLSSDVSLAPEARRVGWVPQETLLVPHLGVAGNLALGARVTVDHARVDALCRIGDLRARSIARLSGGEQKRVALARALSSDPVLLLLDETFAAMDPELGSALRAELRRYCNERAVRTITVTHTVYPGFFDEVYALSDGHLQRL